MLRNVFPRQESNLRSGIRVQIIQDENNTNRFSDRIGRLGGEQGPPNSVRNHAEVEN